MIVELPLDRRAVSQPMVDGTLGHPATPGRNQVGRADDAVGDDGFECPDEAAAVAGEGLVCLRRVSCGADDTWGISDQCSGDEPKVDLASSSGASSLIEPEGYRLVASTPLPGLWPRRDPDHEIRPFIGLAGEEVPAVARHRIAQTQLCDQDALGVHAVLPPCLRHRQAEGVGRKLRCIADGCGQASTTSPREPEMG